MTAVQPGGPFNFTHVAHTGDFWGAWYPHFTSGRLFFLTATLFKRDSVNVRTAQRPTEAHISDGISLVRPAMKLLPPFSSSTYCGVQLPTLLPNMYETQSCTSRIMVCCNAKLHWIRFHGNIHCQYNILNNSNSHFYYFSLKKSNLSHYGCSSTSPFLLFTHFTFQQVLLVISWGAALYPLSGAAQSWPVCHEIPSLYPADWTKSPYLTGSLL